MRCKIILQYFVLLVLSRIWCCQGKEGGPGGGARKKRGNLASGIWQGKSSGIAAESPQEIKHGLRRVQVFEAAPIREDHVQLCTADMELNGGPQAECGRRFRRLDPEGVELLASQRTVPDSATSSWTMMAFGKCCRSAPVAEAARPLGTKQ